MDNSKGGVAEKTPRKGQFQKGDDPRRHTNGSKSKAAVAFNKSLRELLINEGEKTKTGKDTSGNKVSLKNVEWLSISVWQKAIKGESWAVQFIAERTEGKVTQPVSGEIDHNLNFNFGDNGNNDKGE